MHCRKSRLLSHSLTSLLQQLSWGRRLVLPVLLVPPATLLCTSRTLLPICSQATVTTITPFLWLPAEGGCRGWKVSARVREGSECHLAACGSWVLLFLPLVGLWMNLGSPQTALALESVASPLTAPGTGDRRHFSQCVWPQCTFLVFLKHGLSFTFLQPVL